MGKTVFWTGVYFGLMGKATRSISILHPTIHLLTPSDRPSVTDMTALQLDLGYCPFFIPSRQISNLPFRY